MQYAYTAVHEAEVPRASDEHFQHLLDTYVSESNKVVSTWREFRDADLDLEELEADGEFEASEKTLRELGCEALAENADWLAMHRERKLSANLGAK